MIPFYCIQRGIDCYYLNAPNLIAIYTGLANYYKVSGNSDSIVSIVLIIKSKTAHNSKQTQQFQNIDFDEQQRIQQ
jgi:hypothetical protein